jgi:transposase-like protein
MSKSIFSAPHFNDEEAAYAFVEARIWPDGRICPHCGVIDRSGPLKGKSNRVGLYKCYGCRKPFTVKVGTIFEASHIAMRDWLTAIALMTSSKKGISANQLHRTLGITLKSAWFMAHRIREAMSEGYARKEPLGGFGKIVEADETFIGPSAAKDSRVTHRAGTADKMAVYSLIERGGKVRSFHVKDITTNTVMGIMQDQVDSKTAIVTDEAGQYVQVRRVFMAHGTVNHSAHQYRYGNAHTNTVESYFSVLKRGLYGTYQHVSEKHLRRYCDEFDFRHNNRAALGVTDTQRAAIALAGIKGKRLTYRTTRGHRAD